MKMDGVRDGEGPHHRDRRSIEAGEMPEGKGAGRKAARFSAKKSRLAS